MNATRRSGVLVLGRLVLRRTALCAVAALALTIGVQSAAASSHAVHAVAAQAAAPGGVDPDTLPKGAGDAVTIVRWISHGVYQLEVQNTSGVGYIDEFNWVPPRNMTVTAVTSSSSGHCGLVGGNIHCSGKLAPPKCTCQAGGQLTVNFTADGLDPTYANGYWTYYGIEGSYLQVLTVTPVPYHIPSFLPSPSAADLPLCKKGQKSTKKKPCAAR